MNPLREKVQTFVNQVCAGEGWEAPTVVIPSEEEFADYAIQLDATTGIPHEELVKEVGGFSSPSTGKIYINPRSVNRTTVLHELIHYNASAEMYEEVMSLFKNKPHLISTAIELRTEGLAKKLTRKYGDEWGRKVGEEAWAWVVPAALILAFVGIPLAWWAAWSTYSET